jgi:hypothetical protein
MILCEWDAPEGHPGQCCLHLYAFYPLSYFTSVSIFSVCCYSSLSISVVKTSHISVNITKIEKKLDSFYLDYMGMIKTKKHLTQLSL